MDQKFNYLNSNITNIITRMIALDPSSEAQYPPKGFEGLQLAKLV